MRHSSISSDIDIELVSLHGGVFFFDPLQYLVLRPSPLAAADNLAIAFRCQQVVTQYILRIFRVRTVIEWFCDSRIMSQEVRDFKIGSKNLLL